MRPYVLDWLTGLGIEAVTSPNKQGQGRLISGSQVALTWECTPQEVEVLEWLQNRALRTGGTPLQALLAMLMKKKAQHRDCIIARGCLVREAPTWWLRAGSHNLVVPFAEGFVLRVGYRYVTQAKLTQSRAWARLLAEQGIGVPYLLYDTPVLASIGAYEKELGDIRHELRGAQNLPCSTIYPVEPGLLRMPEPGSGSGGSAPPQPGEHFCLVRQIIQQGEDVGRWLAGRNRTGQELRQVLVAVYAVLERYVALLGDKDHEVWFGTDLKFGNMLLLKGGVFLCDLEPGESHTAEMGTLRGVRRESDQCHKLQALEDVLPPENKHLWPLALYLYALSNSVMSIREDMKQNNVQEGGDENSAMDWMQKGGRAPPACPLAAALAVLRDKAAARGDRTTVLADTIMLLAAASWSSDDFWTFEEQLTHYLKTRDNKDLWRKLKRRTRCVVGRLGLLFCYALSCHKCSQIKEEPIKRLLERLKKIFEAKKVSEPRKKQRVV